MQLLTVTDSKSGPKNCYYPRLVYSLLHIVKPMPTYSNPIIVDSRQCQIKYI